MIEESNAPEKADWSIPVDGIIHVPDYLDKLINSTAFQFRLHTISQRTTESEMICRIVKNAEEFFTKNKPYSTSPTTGRCNA